MRFALELIFLDGAARPLSVRDRVAPQRLTFHRRAKAVLELPAQEAR
jgi:uncharacterized membrane protein (UPF0127 family)